MPKGLKRYFGQGQLHFVTFSCYRRLPLLGTGRARNIFVDTLGKICRRYKVILVGYVVMPNHVHLLISESSLGTPSVFLKVLKQRVSRDLRRGLRRGPRVCRGFGSPDSMTSMCGVERRFARSSIICTRIR
jgi:putative transposase